MSASRFQARLAPKAQVVNFTNNNSINNNKTAEADVAGDAKAEKKMKREECICNRGQKVTKYPYYRSILQFLLHSLFDLQKCKTWI